MQCVEERAAPERRQRGHMTTEIVERFVRSLPCGEGYKDRLARELRLIERHKLSQLFLQVREILDLIPDIPHNIRGSAGSSLVCYLLGITHIDPLKWGLGLARFIHDLRPDMPDIDIDIPWNRRKEVWLRIFRRYGTKAVRVSNKVMWKGKSARREAERVLGHGASSVEIEEHVKGLLGKQRHWSLHCGGIVLSDEGFDPSEIIGPHQIAWDKNDVKSKGYYKVDILSSRALGQLAQISDLPLSDYPEQDASTAALWARGDNLGITGGESPAFLKAALGLAASKKRDVILASALIRPAAASGTRSVPFFDTWVRKREQSALVYDDDCIQAIVDKLQVTPARADMIRRDIVKGRIPVPEAISDVAQFTAYSFCKSHAIAYGSVVWALSYHKSRNPKLFWAAALDNCQSMYRKWVHVREAVRSGINRNRQCYIFPPTPVQSYARYGCWWDAEDLPGLSEIRQGKIVRFRAVIGAYRVYNPKLGGNKPVTFVTVWTGIAHRQVVISGADYQLKNAAIIEGIGVEECVQRNTFLRVKGYKLLSTYAYTQNEQKNAHDI